MVLDHSAEPGPSTRNVAISPLGILAFHKDSDVFVADYWMSESGLIEVDPSSVFNLTDPNVQESSPSFLPTDSISLSPPPGDRSLGGWQPTST